MVIKIKIINNNILLFPVFIKVTRKIVNKCLKSQIKLQPKVFTKISIAIGHLKYDESYYNKGG